MWFLKLLLLFSVMSHSWINIHNDPHTKASLSQSRDYESEEGEEDEDSEELAA